MMRSSSALSSSSKISRLQAGYVLVPVNATTRAFLSQFATLPSNFPADLSLFSQKKKPKKRAATSTIDSSPPVNKKRGGGQQSTTTDKLKAPLSVDAGRKVTVPRKKAATIARVQEASTAGVLKKRKTKKETMTNKLKAPLSVDAGHKVTVLRKKAATIAHVSTYCPPLQLKSHFSFNNDEEEDFQDDDEQDDEVVDVDDNDGFGDKEARSWKRRGVWRRRWQW